MKKKKLKPEDWNMIKARRKADRELITLPPHKVFLTHKKDILTKKSNNVRYWEY